MQAGLYLHLDLHRPAQILSQPGQLGQHPQPPHRQGQVQLSRRGQQPLRHPPQYQNVLLHSRVPQGRSLGHLGHRQGVNLVKGGQLPANPLQTQTVGVALEHRNQLFPLQLAQQGPHVPAQLFQIDIQN